MAKKRGRLPSSRSVSSLSIRDEAYANILTALEEADPSTRRQAARLLSRTNNPKAIPDIIAALDDEDPAVRIALVEALGWLGHTDAISALFDAMQQDPSADVRTSAIVALSWIKDKATIPVLIRALGSVDFNIRELAAGALVKHGVLAVSSLITLLQYPGHPTGQEAVRILYKIGQPAVPDLKELIEQSADDPEIRYLAQSVLSRIQNSTSVTSSTATHDEIPPSGKLSLLKGEPDSASWHQPPASEQVTNTTHMATIWIEYTSGGKPIAFVIENGTEHIRCEPNETALLQSLKPMIAAST